MNSKTITLTASALAIYLMIQIVTLATPFKITALMVSALFGLFWGYFSTAQNLGMQAFRLISNAVRVVFYMPKLLLTLKAEAIAGIEALTWFDRIMGIPFNATTLEYRYLEFFGMSLKGTHILGIYFIYAGLHNFIMPYLFYRYFRWTGVYKRLPII